MIKFCFTCFAFTLLPGFCPGGLVPYSGGVCRDSFAQIVDVVFERGTSSSPNRTRAGKAHVDNQRNSLSLPKIGSFPEIRCSVAQTVGAGGSIDLGVLIDRRLTFCQPYGTEWLPTCCQANGEHVFVEACALTSAVLDTSSPVPRRLHQGLQPLIGDQLF